LIGLICQNVTESITYNETVPIEESTQLITFPTYSSIPSSPTTIFFESTPSNTRIDQSSIISSNIETLINGSTHVVSPSMELPLPIKTSFYDTQTETVIVVSERSRPILSDLAETTTAVLPSSGQSEGTMTSTAVFPSSKQSDLAETITAVFPSSNQSDLAETITAVFPSSKQSDLAETITAVFPSSKLSDLAESTIAVFPSSELNLISTNIFTGVPSTTESLFWPADTAVSTKPSSELAMDSSSSTHMLSLSTSEQVTTRNPMFTILTETVTSTRYSRSTSIENTQSTIALSSLFDKTSEYVDDDSSYFGIVSKPMSFMEVTVLPTTTSITASSSNHVMSSVITITTPSPQRSAGEIIRSSIAMNIYFTLFALCKLLM